jgi:hypothetical protein
VRHDGIEDPCDHASLNEGRRITQPCGEVFIVMKWLVIARQLSEKLHIPFRDVFAPGGSLSDL